MDKIMTTVVQCVRRTRFPGMGYYQQVLWVIIINRYGLLLSTGINYNCSYSSDFVSKSTRDLQQRRVVKQHSFSGEV